MRSANDDRSTKARIRDAAIECFAAGGAGPTSIRTIAKQAGVSAGLVMHHFGSKDNLRIACDEHVAAIIRERKGEAMSAGSALDPLAVLRSIGDGPPLARYLARTLVDGSPHVAELVNEIVNDAVAYLEVGVETGLITPSAYPRRRAAILSIWGLGALVLHEHLERLIGVDITSNLADDPHLSSAYLAPAVEIMGGIVTEQTRGIWSEALAETSPGTKEPA